MSRRANTHRAYRAVTHRTIDTSQLSKRQHKEMYTIDVSPAMTSYNRSFLQQSTSRGRKLSINAKKLPSLRSDKAYGLSPEKTFGLTTTNGNLERTVSKEIKS